MDVSKKVNTFIEKQGITRKNLYDILVKEHLKRYEQRVTDRVNSPLESSKTYGETWRQVENAGIRLAKTYDAMFFPSKSIFELRKTMEEYTQDVYEGNIDKIRLETKTYESRL